MRFLEKMGREIDVNEYHFQKFTGTNGGEKLK